MGTYTGTNGEQQNHAKVVQRLVQHLFVVQVEVDHQRFHAAAQVANAHGAGERVAVYLAEGLHLHGAGEGHQCVGGQVQRVGDESDAEEQQNLHHQHQLPPVQALGLPVADVDRLGHCHAQCKGEQRYQIVQHPRKIPVKGGLAHQHDVAGLSVGKYLAAANVGVGVL